MQYVMSDLHGCYREYLEALETIGFSDRDILYVNGDVVDRGEQPLEILSDMMMRDNVYPILGNHEFEAMSVLRKLGREITDRTIAELTEDDLKAYGLWVNDGGETTLRGYLAASQEKREMILEYLEEFSLFEETEAAGIEYLIVHAGLEPFDPDKEPDDYTVHEMIFTSPDYEQEYYPDRYVITGHTPTLALPAPYKGKIFRRNRHIAVDCGCVFGGNLAVLCLETGEEFYIPKR